MCKYNKIFCGSAVLKVNKLRNKRAGDDLRCLKSLESIFSKQEISGWLACA